MLPYINGINPGEAEHAHNTLIHTNTFDCSKEKESLIIDERARHHAWLFLCLLSAVASGGHELEAARLRAIEIILDDDSPGRVDQVGIGPGIHIARCLLDLEHPVAATSNHAHIAPVGSI